jgi:hypothetical protein
MMNWGSKIPHAATSQSSHTASAVASISRNWIVVHLTIFPLFHFIYYIDIVAMIWAWCLLDTAIQIDLYLCDLSHLIPFHLCVCSLLDTSQWMIL